MTTLRGGLSGLSGLGRASGAAGRFLGWWRQGLLAWLPHRWKTVLGLARDRLLLVPQAGQLADLRWQAEAGVQPLSQVPLPLTAADLDRLLAPRLAALPRWLVLPPGQVLRRRLALPAAAADRLHEVLAFEIDRQTPFERAAVCWDARLAGRRADGQLDAELVVAPRSVVEQALAALGPMADGLAGVDVATAQGAPLGVNLLPATQRVQRRDPLQGWNRALVLAALVLLALAGAQVLHNRRAAADALAASVQGQAARAHAVSVQRQQLQDMVDGSTFLDRQRAARPTMTELLDEISRRLPQNSYLEKVSIEGDRVLLIGLSPEAAGLVKRMEGSRLWTAPALTGALQTDRRTHLDRFSLTAQLAGAAAPGARTGGAGAGLPR